MDTVFVTLLTVFIALQTCYAPPVTQDKKEGYHNATDEQDSEIGGIEDYMEYHRYLSEVVNALESDPDFRSKLEKADEKEIKSGRIAEELQFVSHHVRTRLDEIKRRELQRLKELVEKKMQLEKNDVDSNFVNPEDPTHNHLDHKNPHTFEIEDLKKLIAKTTEDLAQADKLRKEDFKKYEMEKELKRQQELNSTQGEDRAQLEKKYKELEEKHKKHEKLHEPGHQAQLEEVWQEQDQMQQEFDPKTFFMLHDLDGNGLWDQEEVKALFIKELDKMYQEGAPEDDMRERIEEMERMRESVFNEMDRNRDGFIDYSEFHRQATSNDFKEDHGWKSLDEQTRPYTDEELAQMAQYYHHTRQQAGHHPPPPGMVNHPGVPQGVPVNQGGYQQPPQQQYHQQIPQGGYQQQMPHQGGHQQPPQQQYHQQMPQGGYQQAPQQQYQQGVPPQHQGVPPGGYQQQVPPQQGVPHQAGYQQQVPPQQGVPYQGGYQQPGQVQVPQGQNQQQQGINSNQINQQPNQLNINNQPSIQLNQGERIPNQHQQPKPVESNLV